MENTILAVDAALGPCSVALMRGPQVLAYGREEQPQMQAARLVPMIEEAMKQAGLAYAALDSIACTVGPGTFTGLRIGLAAARGIGFAAGKPVHGISTLAVTAVTVAQAVPLARHILVVLNAGKGEAYGQMFHVEQKIYSDKQTEAAILSPEAIIAMAHPDVVVAGNIPPEWMAGKPFLHLSPDARAAGFAALSSPELLVAPEPLYIRPPDARPAQLIAN